jgi:hypothetical protein
METHETMRRDAAGQIFPELTLYERRKRMLARLLTCEKRFQLFGDNAVQYGLFRLARNIFKCSLTHTEALSSAQAVVESAVLEELALPATETSGLCATNAAASARK